MQRRSLALSLIFNLAFAAAVFLPVAQPLFAADKKAQAPSDETTMSKAQKYCVRHGGEVDVREPCFNTNADPQDWLRLSGSRQFCKFTSKKDGSRIHVLLSTLYSDQPSLAALAYYAQVPLTGSCNGNPASCYCSQIGGSDLFGGINASGGGWVQKSDPIDTALEACLFPDMSSIDSWGLAYHSFGIVRGKNLDKTLKFPNPYAKK